MKDKIIEILKEHEIDMMSGRLRAISSLSYVDIADHILAIQEEEAKKMCEEAEKYLDHPDQLHKPYSEVKRTALQIASGLKERGE